MTKSSRYYSTPVTLLAVVGITAGCLFSLSGCSNSQPANKPPTADQVKAFRGGEPTAQDREDMKKEVETAAAYRKAHPEKFPTAAEQPK